MSTLENELKCKRSDGGEYDKQSRYLLFERAVSKHQNHRVGYGRGGGALRVGATIVGRLWMWSEF